MKAEAELSPYPSQYRWVLKGCNVNQRPLRSSRMKIPIVQMLLRAGIYCSMSDVINSVYQG